MTQQIAVRRRRADRARQVADVLRHQVLAGTFRAGTLPAEPQLCHDFAASRNTVRQALGLLAAEGLVERQPGVGTLVVTAKYAHGLHRLAGLAETRPTQVGGQTGDRGRDVPADDRRDRRHRGAHPTRTDALRRSHLHP